MIDFTHLTSTPRRRCRWRVGRPKRCSDPWNGDGSSVPSAVIAKLRNSRGHLQRIDGASEARSLGTWSCDMWRCNGRRSARAPNRDLVLCLSASTLRTNHCLPNDLLRVPIRSFSSAYLKLTRSFPLLTEDCDMHLYLFISRSPLVITHHTHRRGISLSWTETTLLSIWIHKSEKDVLRFVPAWG